MRDNSTDEILRRLAEQKFALDQAAIVAQTDVRGNIEYINDKFCEISGYSRDELLGKNHRILNSGTHSKEFFTQMWKTISKGQTWKGEICNRSKSGRLYWVYTTIVPFLDVDNHPIQYLAIRQDITGLKEAQQTVLAQQAQLVANSKIAAIGEMASAITHEINNPLGVILGRCEMLKELMARGNVDMNNFSRLVDTIEVTGKRIDRIVKSMRVLAHKGEEDPFQQTPIQTLIDDLLDLNSERFRNNRVKLEVNQFDPSLSIDCRSHEVLQVLVNLLNNAFDAVVDLEIRWVRLDVAAVDDGKIQLSVTDSGAGIRPEVLEKIFDPFYSTKKVQYGTGLGLSISKRIIQRHGGSLDYDRNSSNTRFVILLPQHH